MIKNIVQEWTWIVNNISTNHNPRLILKFFIESINVKRFFICYTTRNENNNILAQWRLRICSKRFQSRITFALTDFFDEALEWRNVLLEFHKSDRQDIENLIPRDFKKWKFFRNFPVYKYFRRLWPHEWVFSPLLELFLGSIPDNFESLHNHEPRGFSGQIRIDWLILLDKRQQRGSEGFVHFVIHIL